MIISFKCIPNDEPSVLSTSICMGDSLKELLSIPLEGAGEGDLVAHSESQ